VTTITNNGSYTSTTLTIANVSSTILDGFRITRKFQSYAAGYYSQGMTVSGIYCYNLDDSNLVQNCTVEGVYAVTTEGGPRERNGFTGAGLIVTVRRPGLSIARYETTILPMGEEFMFDIRVHSSVDVKS